MLGEVDCSAEVRPMAVEFPNSKLSKNQIRTILADMKSALYAGVDDNGFLIMK